MLPLKILYSFIPWFAFYLLSHNTTTSVLTASLVAVILTIALEYKSIKQGFLLPCTSLAVFIMLYIITKSNIFPYVVDNSLSFANFALPLIIWISVLIKKPFTRQYAKLVVAPELWDSPLFIKITTIQSLSWAILLTISILPGYVIPNSYTWIYYAFEGICIFSAIILNKKIPGIVIGQNFWNTAKNLPPVDNKFLRDGYKPVHEELTLEKLDVEGSIPDDLNGRYLRNGSNPYFPPYTYTYPIDGDGMIHQVTINNKQASYKNRFVKTKGLISEIKANRALYAGIQVPVPSDPRLADGEAVKNTAAIHIIGFGNEKLLALYEAATAYILDNELNTIGEWKPVIDEVFNVNAHFRRDINNGHIYMCNYNISNNTHFLEIFEFDQSFNLVSRIPVDKPRPTMIHDFVITENYIVIFDCPAFFNINDKNKPFFGFEPASSTNIILINKKSKNIKFIKNIDSFFVYHFVNAYEDGDKIFIDFVYHKELQFNPTKDKAYPPVLFRGEINLTTMSYNHWKLLDNIVEFPNFNHEYSGLKYKFGYILTKTDNSLENFDAILKYDFSNNNFKIIDLKLEVGEVTFVPKNMPDSEDDGYLVLFAYNPSKDTSDFIIIEANGDNKILSRIHIPVRVPHGLHGTWITKKIANT